MREPVPILADEEQKEKGKKKLHIITALKKRQIKECNAI